MKFLKSFLLVYFFSCFISANAQNNADLEALKGIWLRQDLIESLQTTHSIFETKEILEKEKTAEFLTIAITKEHNKKDTLSLCIGGSFYSSMPLVMLTSKTEITKDNYYIAREFFGKKLNTTNLLLFKIINDDLEVILKNTKTQESKKFTFQKVSNEKDFICSGQVYLSYFYAVEGNYRLLDANGNILNDNIWFDETGNTNFPDFLYFGIFDGFQNSIHHAMDTQGKTETQKREMLGEGAIDKEDLFFLRKHKEYQREGKQDFIIQKTAKGFDIYTLKEDNISKWQLLHKKDLVYKLERKEGKKKKE